MPFSWGNFLWLKAWEKGKKWKDESKELNPKKVEEDREWSWLKTDRQHREKTTIVKWIFLGFRKISFCSQRFQCWSKWISLPWNLPFTCIFLIIVFNYIITIHFMVILQVEKQGFHGSVNMKLQKILIILVQNRSHQLNYSRIFILICNDMSYLEQRSLCHLCADKQL